MRHSARIASCISPVADFEPKGAVSRLYGVYREGMVLANGRVCDRCGWRYRWSYVSSIGVNPGAQGILFALEELQRSWRPIEI